MADQPLLGVFKEPKGLGGGYTPAVDTGVPERHKGRQFVVSDVNAVTGKGRDAWLDKTVCLSTPGDRYVEQANLARMMAKRMSGTPISDKPFRPSNPCPTAGRASGALYGTFGPFAALSANEGRAGSARAGGAAAGDASGSGRPTTAPVGRNFYTAGPKRTGPGLPDQSRLLGGKAYAYVPDEYNRARTVEKGMKQAARARIVKPFMGGGRVGNTFSSDAQLYASIGGTRPASRSRSAVTPWRPNSTMPPDHTFHQIPYVPHKDCDPVPLGLRASAKDSPHPKAFVPVDAGHKRLSMWSVNPYERDARPANPDALLTL